MSKVFKVDFHCHPLAHEHYPNVRWCDEIRQEDIGRIKRMLELQSARGLDAVCITDHNYFTSSIFAQTAAKMMHLPIKVITGAECSVYVHSREIHVLAIGCKHFFDFDIETGNLVELINIIHACGGLAILAHPHHYIDIAKYIVELFDGYEEYNGTAAFNGVDTYNHPYAKGFKIKGSDFHLDSLESSMNEHELAAVTIVDESMSKLYSIVRSG